MRLQASFFAWKKATRATASNHATHHMCRDVTDRKQPRHSTPAIKHSTLFTKYSILIVYVAPTTQTSEGNGQLMISGMKDATVAKANKQERAAKSNGTSGRTCDVDLSGFCE